MRPGVPGCKLFSTGLSPHESISEHFGISFPDLEKLRPCGHFNRNLTILRTFESYLDED